MTYNVFDGTLNLALSIYPLQAEKAEKDIADDATADLQPKKKSLLGALCTELDVWYVFRVPTNIAWYQQLLLRRIAI